MQAEHMNMHGMPEAETFEGGVSKKPTVWVRAKNVRVVTVLPYLSLKLFITITIYPIKY